MKTARSILFLLLLFSTREAHTSSVAIVNVPLEKLVARTPIIAIGRVVATGQFVYPPAQSPGPGGVPYWEVEVEGGLKGQVPKGKIKVFDPRSKFAYEKAELIKAGVISYADSSYRTSAQGKVGERLLFFLQTERPDFYPKESYLLTCGAAFDDLKIKAQVERLIRPAP